MVKWLVYQNISKLFSLKLWSDRLNVLPNTLNNVYPGEDETTKFHYDLSNAFVQFTFCIKKYIRFLGSNVM